MGTAEIKRASELWLCARLAALTGLTFNAQSGGNDPAADATVQDAPGGMVAVTKCQSHVHGGFQLDVTIGYMSNMGDADAATHAAKAKLVEQAIGQLPIGPDATLQITVHGTRLDTCDTFTDDEERVRGDAWNITMGASG